MLKKIVLAVLLIGFIGILVWGGVNRTSAKTNSSEGRKASNQNSEYAEVAAGTGVQQRGTSNQGGGNYARNEEDAESMENISDQDVALSQSGNSRNNPQEGSPKGNSANTKSGISDSSVTSSANQTQTQGNGNRSGRGNGNGQGSGQGGGQGSGSTSLNATEIEALNMALNDEYHALAVYQSVIATFGEVEPFFEIAAAEQRHIDALINQYNKYGLTIPANPWIGNVPIFDSVQQACQAGVDAEIANVELYEQLFSMTDNPGLTQVFTNLSNASLNSHLPQFEVCQ